MSAWPDPDSGAAADTGAAPEGEPPAAPPPGDAPGAAAAPPAGGGEGGIDPATLSPDELVAELQRTAEQRDELRDALQRTQADFENYRKRTLKQQADASERAAAALVEQLLPVLDACDGAIRHDAIEVEPIYAALLGTLEKAGLERIDPGGESFDPNRHEAVLHEPATEPQPEPVVSDVMRAGYSWKGRVVRPAMVKVRG